eukprot:3647325-Alexandrium_andersonii.AAC.1
MRACRKSEPDCKPKINPVSCLVAAYPAFIIRYIAFAEGLHPHAAPPTCRSWRKVNSLREGGERGWRWQ